MKNQQGAFVIVILLLLAGSGIYILCRPGYGFFNIPILSDQTLTAIPGWVRYSLPDGLWMMALMTSILAIWNFQWSFWNRCWYGITLWVGIGFETLQWNGIIPGTFDITDLVCILLGGFMPLSVVLFHRKAFLPC